MLAGRRQGVVLHVSAIFAGAVMAFASPLSSCWGCKCCHAAVGKPGFDRSCCSHHAMDASRCIAPAFDASHNVCRCGANAAPVVAAITTVKAETKSPAPNWLVDVADASNRAPASTGLIQTVDRGPPAVPLDLRLHAYLAVWRI